MALAIAFTVLGLVLCVAFVATERAKSRIPEAGTFDSLTLMTLADTLCLNDLPQRLTQRAITPKTHQATTTSALQVAVPTAWAPRPIHRRAA